MAMSAEHVMLQGKQRDLDLISLGPSVCHLLGTVLAVSCVLLDNPLCCHTHLLFFFFFLFENNSPEAYG
jgi:hypothetical protein